MTIHIRRSQTNTLQAYTIDTKETILLNILSTLKKQDATLTFSAGCRASICGTCTIRVNGKETLACEHKVQEGDTIEPLQYHPVLRDLKVNKRQAHDTLSQSQTWIQTFINTPLNPKDAHKSEKQTDCILCDACYSACPVYAVNPDFLGPFSLTRIYRYSIDKRESKSKQLLDNVQTNGIWDCTLCGECTAVCPKGIDPKMDITMLRSSSIQVGYSDPSFTNQSFGTPDFSNGFGF